MRKSRFTEEQIIKVLKEHAAGLSAGEVRHRSSVLQPKVLPFDPAELAEPVDKRFHIGLGNGSVELPFIAPLTRRVGCAFAGSGPTATKPNEIPPSHARPATQYRNCNVFVFAVERGTSACPLWAISRHPTMSGHVRFSSDSGHQPDP